MTATYPIQSSETTPRPKAPPEGIYEDSRLVSAWTSGEIRIENYHREDGEVYLAYRVDTGESILQVSIEDRTGPEPVTRETPVEKCYSLWTVIQALAREWGRPLERAWPVDLPVDKGIPAASFMEALKAAGVEAPFLADCESKARRAEA